MDEKVSNMDEISKKSGAGGFLKTLGLIVFACFLTAMLIVASLKIYVFPGEFKPVALSSKEELTLEEKLDDLKPAYTKIYQESDGPAQKPQEPMPYSEAGATREMRFTEREINALLAKNTDLATKVSIHLEPDLATARLRIPLDPEMPLFGGKTLNASAGLELRYEEARPIVILKGVTLWGIPVPNAWLGNLKNVDLVKEFESEQGFWKAFADGVENITVQNGFVTVKFKE